MEIRPVGAELIYTEWRTDSTKFIDIFRDYANTP